VELSGIELFQWEQRVRIGGVGFALPDLPDEVLREEIGSRRDEIQDRL
jgi:hypothetical protein